MILIFILSPDLFFLDPYAMGRGGNEWWFSRFGNLSSSKYIVPSLTDRMESLILLLEQPHSSWVLIWNSSIVKNVLKSKQTHLKWKNENRKDLSNG